MSYPSRTTTKRALAGERGIRRGMSMQAATADAVAELLDAISQDHMEMILLFCSPQYDVPVMLAEIARHAPGVPILGCTTAGEITPIGYRQGTVTGLSLSATHFAASVRLIEPTSSFEITDGPAVTQALTAEHNAYRRRLHAPNTFALLINDGLSMREEIIVSALRDGLGEIPLIGGSAGDNLAFRETSVFLDGRVLTNASLLVLVSTDLAFRVFQTQHFKPLDQKMVITRADPSRRLVMEINAEPAADEYARLIGLDRAELTPLIFAAYPLVVKAGGRHYVRAIQRVDDDGLHFFCAIDEGIVLSVAESGDLRANLVSLFDALRQELGGIEAVIGFDCVLRYVEMEQRQMLSDVSRIMAQNNVVGFNTYGEQFGMMHMSQTFTGIALGPG
ncbi:FIST domain containing protein [Vineibacter terrae]|uniref:FIST domain containing protein n=1 Tax=Vineibacter terrae TaxID=2586908 RepID=A0A5C8PGI6_9HYPH|nr:FIST N-terminal domain-containing protein [Vineibacter terrae]TXL72741.1 FIST domain containing protein [Vineibacter terrae]